MSSEDIVLKLQKRDTVGKGLAKIRKNGLIPAVIHDHGKPSIIVMGVYSDVAKVFNIAGKHHPVQLDIDGKTEAVIIKDVSISPVKNLIDHVVFQAIRMDEKIETEVPVLMVGDSPAQKIGLLLIPHLSAVEIEALPKDLPDKLELDITSLAEIGDKLTAASLVIPSGVTMLTEPDILIVSVEETKAQISEETEEATEGEEGAEGETTEEATEGETSDKPAE
ncbi:MAG TPA: 50S ribosomal protein L25 [Candidatus Saccharimonadales bacterium]|jgi:large subunit ribosomal protein L25|nr:50S ribosomal protein L25 [Candidatus Saccharimonadales bacterium]